MKRAWPILAVLGFLGLICGPASADLESGIAAVLKDKLLAKASVGVCVVRMPAGEGRAMLLYERQSSTPLMPASNMKVVTTAAALDGLGAGFRFRTRLVLRGEDLVLVGDGDPTFGDNELLKKSNWHATTVFNNWAKGLKAAGITRLRNVVVDDSIFDETLTHPHWEARQLGNRYAAQITGMTLNVGCVDFFVRSTGAGKPVSYRTSPPTKYITVQNTCVGGANAVVVTRNGNSNTVYLRGSCAAGGESEVSIPIHDPALLAVTTLAESLRSGGIEVGGKVGRERGVRELLERNSAGLKLLAVHETPISHALARANKDSMNLYAESLSKRLGAATSGGSGSWTNGSAAVGAFLKKIGADERQFRIDDGSGLSRENRVSAATMIRILSHMHASSARDVFIASLAVAGEDGTLDERFKTDLRGRVFAKTGFINGVSALSGYLKTRDGQWCAFSILMNGLPAGTNGRAKQLQESIVRAVDVSVGKSAR